MAKSKAVTLARRNKAKRRAFESGNAKIKQTRRARRTQAQQKA